ncbi:hypothetical protein C8J57DRAFT_1258561 [Mycena rebaudengoi]|nr:hypothetical protein C8J57DRAFT_1258561 [Mycena rebaudengoi]
MASGTYILKELCLCFGQKELLTLTSIVARNAVTTNHQLRITSHSGLTSTAAHRISFPQPTTSNTPPPTPASPDKLPQWPSRRHTAPAVPPHPIEHLLRPTPSSVLVQATYNPSSTSYPTTGDGAVHPGKQHDHVRPRRLLADAAIHDAGRDATHADGEDLYFYTLVPSPVSSASTSSGSATSELCSASEESTSESDSEGEEEGYDAQAYTERTTDFAMRHTPAAADFAQPRAHRPIVYLSSPASAASDNGRESDERDAELMYVPVSSKARDHPAAPRCSAPTITPSTTPAAATRSPGPWSRRKGCTGCASSLPRRSPNPPRMRTGRSSSRSQYGCVRGGYAGRWGVQSRGRRLCGHRRGIRVRRSRRGCIRVGGSSSGRRPRCSARRSNTSNRRTSSSTQHQQHMPQHTSHQQQRHAAPHACTTTQWTPPHPAYAVAGHGQWTPPRLPRFADLERWSPGVGEVVPSHAPQVPSHGLAPPAHTHIPSHTLP